MSISYQLLSWPTVLSAAIDVSTLSLCGEKDEASCKACVPPPSSNYSGMRQNRHACYATTACSWSQGSTVGKSQVQPSKACTTIVAVLEGGGIELL